MSTSPQPLLASISAVTLGVRDMARSVRFYEQLGFVVRYGGADASFTSFQVGPNYLNLAPREPAGWWGCLIVYVTDVEAMYARVRAAGIEAAFPPRDAPWGERYFHVRDPDGHELSFARPLDG